MKLNLIKMDISKQQETQQQTHSCHFPATSCRRLGGGAVCVQMEVEATPPSPPRRMQISHSNKSYKGRLLLALPFLCKLGTSAKKGMIPDHLFCHGNGDPLSEGSPAKEIPLYSSLPKSPAQTPQYQPPSLEWELLGLWGPQAKHSTAPARPSPACHAQENVHPSPRERP